MHVDQVQLYRAIQGASLLTGKPGSMATLARVLQVNRATVSKWSRGKTCPRGYHLEGIMVLDEYWNEHIMGTDKAWVELKKIRERRRKK